MERITHRDLQPTIKIKMKNHQLREVDCGEYLLMFTIEFQVLIWQTYVSIFLLFKT